jgi:hypothetical protein
MRTILRNGAMGCKTGREQEGIECRLPDLEPELLPSRPQILEGRVPGPMGLVKGHDFSRADEPLYIVILTASDRVHHGGRGNSILNQMLQKLARGEQPPMLPTTQREIERVTEYMQSQAPDLTVEFAQKVYSENLLHVRHDVWDVHTNVDRWWVITEPMNLYAQEQFPNMDLALTFHVGLCLRVPRSERQKLSEIPAEPFAKCLRYLQEAFEALAQAQEVADYQSIGVRCRETLLAFVDIAQTVIPWASPQEPPKRADVRAWAEHICNVTLSGESHEQRRHLFKTLLESAWKFTNWLTHTKSSKWHDAEAAFSVTENAIGLSISAVIRHVRGVPEQCPACGSQRLSPQRGYHENFPDVEWERPTCDKCGWTGEPVRIDNVLELHDDSLSKPSAGECITPTTALTHLKRPYSRTE